MQHHMFESHTKAWEPFCQEVADFVTGLGPKKLVTISHSHDSTTGVITVWFHEDVASERSR